MRKLHRITLFLLVLTLLVSILPTASADVWEPEDMMSDEDFEKGLIVAVILLVLVVVTVVLYYVFKKRR